jgi:hypothetical protein
VREWHCKSHNEWKKYHILSWMLWERPSLTTNYYFSLNPYMTLLSLIMFFIVPFPHPFGTNDKFFLKPIDYTCIWHFSHSLCILLWPTLTLKTNIDVFLSPNMTLFSLIMFFTVPSLHPLGQIMSSLLTLMINMKLLSIIVCFIVPFTLPITTNNDFSVNSLDYKWNFPHSLCVLWCFPALITTNNDFSVNFLDYKWNFSHSLRVLWCPSLTRQDKK